MVIPSSGFQFMTGQDIKMTTTKRPVNNQDIVYLQHILILDGSLIHNFWTKKLRVQHVISTGSSNSKHIKGYCM